MALGWGAGQCPPQGRPAPEPSVTAWQLPRAPFARDVCSPCCIICAPTMLAPPATMRSREPKRSEFSWEHLLVGCPRGSGRLHSTPRYGGDAGGVTASRDETGHKWHHPALVAMSREGQATAPLAAACPPSGTSGAATRSRKDLGEPGVTFASQHRIRGGRQPRMYSLTPSGTRGGEGRTAGSRARGPRPCGPRRALSAET